MTELIGSPQALRDLEAVRAYIALDSTLYADLTVRRIVSAVERLKVPNRAGSYLNEIRRTFAKSLWVGYRVPTKVRGR